MLTGVHQQNIRANMQNQRQIAQEPQERYCKLKEKKVQVLVVYPNYRNVYDKGEPVDIYCSEIINCYTERIPCRYSGISPLYPDPFNLN